MPQGVSTKGYKMTENRRRILELLVGEGGTLKSQDGKATSLMHGLLDSGSSVVALNASLRELENIGFIERDIDGRRTYGISITDLGRSAIGAEDEETAPPVVDEIPSSEIDAAAAAAAAAESEASQAGDSTEWDWDFDAELPDGDIDYNIVTGVILKAALRGMEGPSNGELDYANQKIETLTERIAVLESEVDRFRAEAAQAIAERDQLQKNLNIIMSKSEGRGSRGTDPIRRLLSPEERAGLDALMRQIPARRGE